MVQWFNAIENHMQRGNAHIAALPKRTIGDKSLTLIIRTDSCELNRKESEFECYGLITSVGMLLGLEFIASIKDSYWE